MLEEIAVSIDTNAVVPVEARATKNAALPEGVSRTGAT
jgi:hypothetical protein